MKRALAALLLLCVSCNDPVRADEEKAVPDDPAHRDGPEHHPGQQCTACHASANFRGPTEFSFAGTIYEFRDDTRTGDARALVGARVIIVDRAGGRMELTTNSSGNFYVNRSDYDPPMPVFIHIRGPNGEFITDQNGRYVNQMRSHIGREGGCGFCHKPGLRNDPNYPSEIYFARTEAELRAAGLTP
ncbi:MAG TPA: hypothetical protein VIF62_33850 [Labilithrix sp.]|jgi:hypothetical protein